MDSSAFHPDPEASAEPAPQDRSPEGACTMGAYQWVDLIVPEVLDI